MSWTDPLFSWSMLNREPPKQYSVTIMTLPLSAHAPTKSTRFGCLTLISVLTSRLNSFMGLSTPGYSSTTKRSFLIATSISLNEPLYTSAEAPVPITFSNMSSDRRILKKSWPFENALSRKLSAFSISDYFEAGCSREACLGDGNLAC